MSTFRAILVALIALSVAMLPVAGGTAIAKSAAQSTAQSMVAAQADCCAHGKPCQNQGKNDCGSVAGCALKCFSLSAAIVAPSAMKLTVSAVEKLGLVTPAFRSPSENPPLPPPRV
jgi:hypothetical protein